MDFFEEIKNYKSQGKAAEGHDPVILLEDELREALSLYWKTAARILKGSGTRLHEAPEEYYAFRNNFFSALFLYSYHRAGIDREHRVLYAALNQCIRGMVTGCDNILDDEYKKTLETDLPEGGSRFRSVLDIMVSDRVLFEILAQALPGQWDKILDASAISLRTLVRSGVEEAGEEAGISSILTPDEVLSSVHHFKTGLLFQSPWAIPALLEKHTNGAADDMTAALYSIGLGCQIMDDIVDLASDIRGRRHNFVVSLIYHELGHAASKKMEAIIESGRAAENYDILSDFPKAKAAVEEKIRDYLITGLTALFESRHRFLVEPAVCFLGERIGAVLIPN